MKSRTAAPAKRRRREARRAPLRVRLSRLGDRVRTLSLPAGTTIKDLVKTEGLERSLVRLNGHAVRLAAKLKTGDIVVAVPQTIAGGSMGRYAHLDLEECRRRMSAKDFQFFVNFVGADAIGFRDSDLEP